jgi:hypothetical protein
MTEPVTPASSAAPAPRKGFRAFVKKHDALFTVLGAGIVFLSFYVKEGVRDRSKEMASSINTARTMFAVRSAIGDIASSLHSERSIVELTKSRLENPGPVSMKLLFDYVQVSINSLSTERSEHWDTYRIASDLLNSLPVKSQELAVTNSELEKTLNEKKPMETANALGKSLAELEASKDLDDLDKELSLFHIMSVIPSIDMDGEGFKISNFGQRVLEEAKKQNDKQERTLKWTTYATYATFTLGWILGLIGKLFKLPALGGGESEG